MDFLPSLHFFQISSQTKFLLLHPSRLHFLLTLINFNLLQFITHLLFPPLPTQILPVFLLLLRFPTLLLRLIPLPSLPVKPILPIHYQTLAIRCFLLPLHQNTGFDCRCVYLSLLPLLSFASAS